MDLNKIYHLKREKNQVTLIRYEFYRSIAQHLTLTRTFNSIQEDHSLQTDHDRIGNPNWLFLC